ncbi:MAG TPA: sugar transferase [Bryobacteraceae bacterium]|nr:sugar transferase [Bryobacteraceae bacterium]
MNSIRKQPIRLLPAALDLCACLGAYYAIFRIFPAERTDWIAAIPASAVTSWLAAIALQARESGVSLWIDQFFYAAGLTMLMQYGLAYLFGFWPAPIGAIVSGAAASVMLLAGLHRWDEGASGGEAGPGVVFLGFGSMAAALAPHFEKRILGVVESEPERAPRGLPYLGPPEELERIVAETQPGSIVAAGGRAPGRAVMEVQYAGTPVIDGAALHESLLGRLRWDAMRPEDLLFSRSTNADRMGMAVQAIYTNVIGVATLVALSPLLILPALAIAVFGRGGQVLEHTECLGFQMIPFRLLQFGTRGKDGRLHAPGKALLALHLESLPRLINVVRGEMAFFGPPPARLEFARRLGRLIPVYAHRFTVKPGILGWSQINLAGAGDAPDEALRLEYDLYYVKQNSVSLDLEILLKTLLRPRSFARRQKAEGL